jgi:hypothetical protein
VAITPQQQAIVVANGLTSAAQELIGLFKALATLDQQWTDWGAANILAAMGTVAVNTDGSLGTADATPNTSHPLNPTTYPSLVSTLSSTQIGQLKTILDGVETYVSGGAVTQQAGARAILNAASGG